VSDHLKTAKALGLDILARAAKSSNEAQAPARPVRMTPGNMRQRGVQRLVAYCLNTLSTCPSIRRAMAFPRHLP
jgi:hypothetical protein